MITNIDLNYLKSSVTFKFFDAMPEFLLTTANAKIENE